ncbi:Dipeptidyl peptidase 4 [Basidiobolus ranarum]|uniref:Dipeptidyl peptidase 4 n=1 Tax=Basidiobolus ranarum TaxID=34480 RepID=A0ABR2WYK9_9FUNG
MPQSSIEDQSIANENPRDSFESEVHSRVNLRLEEGEKKQPRKLWVKLIIALAIGLLLFSILTSLTTFTIKRMGGAQHMEDGSFRNISSSRGRFQFNDIFHSDFYISRKDLNWLKTPDGDGSYIVKENGQMLLKSVANNSSYVLIDRRILSKIPYFEFSVSPDLQYIMFAVNGEKVWRHSYTASYLIYELNTGLVRSLTRPNAKINLATWSPTGHSVAFVRENNVYVRLNLELEIQITFDGSAQVFNGIPDWIYEEEVYQSNRALWWSPDSTQIAFLRLDESEVPEYIFPMYHSDDNGDDPYVKEVSMRYPKPGFANPLVSVMLYNIYDNQPPTPFTPIAPISFGDGFSPEDTLIVEVVWMTSTSTHLMVRMMNRVQDKLRMFLVDVAKKTTSLVRTEDSDDGAWIETHQTLQFIPANKKYDLAESGYIDIVIHNGYNHYAIFSPISSKEPLRYLTQGDWEVVEKPKAIDIQNGVMYYISTERGSVQRHLYSVTLDGKTKKLLTPGPVDATYDVSFSPSSQYYLLSYNGPDIPWQKVKKVADPDFAIDLEKNQKLKDKLDTYDLPLRRYKRVKIGNNEFNALEIVPPDFQEDKRYNVLFNVYGGPGSQLVSQAFKLDFHTYLVSDTHIPTIVVIVDGRGTGYRGRKFRTCVSQNLGKLETQDQIDVARHWASLDYVNPENLAIWGWSFGGFVTSKAIESNSGLFKLGIAVAPVTNWKFYDSIYTERYMKTPLLNPDGYKSSTVKNMTGFHNAQFLLVHGTGDDNVHFQNSAYLVDELTRNSVHNYRVQFFTDSDHSITKNNAHREIYSLLLDTLNNTFHA